MKSSIFFALFAVSAVQAFAPGSKPQQPASLSSSVMQTFGKRVRCFVVGHWVCARVVELVLTAGVCFERTIAPSAVMGDKDVFAKKIQEARQKALLRTGKTLLRPKSLQQAKFAASAQQAAADPEGYYAQRVADMRQRAVLNSEAVREKVAYEESAPTSVFTPRQY